MDAMLQHIYGQQYYMDDDFDFIEDSAIIYHVKVYNLADKYLLESLKHLARINVKVWRTDDSCRQLLDAANAIVTNRYGNTEGLRQVIADCIYENKSILTYVMAHGEHLLDEHGLSLELLRSHLNASISMRCKCGNGWVFTGTRLENKARQTTCPYCGKTAEFQEFERCAIAHEQKRVAEDD